jgi:hypothetical protein
MMVFFFSMAFVINLVAACKSKNFTHVMISTLLSGFFLFLLFYLAIH